MDTRENKKTLRGDYGYVKSVKQHNLRVTLALVGACLIVVVLGISLSSQVTVYLNLVSVLLILPTAQFMAKYFSFRTYKPLSEDEFKKIDSISSDFLVLGEMPVIRGKKTYFLKCMVISKAGVYALIGPEKDIKETKKITKETREMLSSIIRPKGFNEKVVVFSDYNEYVTELTTKVKSMSQGGDEKAMAKVAKSFLMKTQ